MRIVLIIIGIILGCFLNVFVLVVFDMVFFVLSLPNPRDLHENPNQKSLIILLRWVLLLSCCIAGGLVAARLTKRKHGDNKEAENHPVIPAEKLKALIDAAKNGYLADVQAHLDAGVDVNAKDNGGQTPLHYATRYGHKEIAELLIANGADVNAKDELEETPLDFADGEIADFLRIHGGKSGGELALMPLLVYSKDQLAIDGWVGLKYEVLYSSDLKEWQVLETVTLETSPQVYVDKTATEQPMRFYQLRLND